MEVTNQNSNAAKRATLVQMPLLGEPATDKAFKCAEDQQDYRVRVLPVEIAGSVAGLPTATLISAYDITITALNQDGTVKTNAAGQAVIVANTRWTVDAATFSSDHPENTAANTLQRLIEQKVYEAMTVSKAQADLANVMAGWGDKTGVGVSVTSTPTSAGATVKLGGAK